MLKIKEPTRFQKSLHYSSWRLFEARIVHRIFDSAIYDMTQMILKEIMYHEPEESDGKIFYTEWNYDSVNQTVVNTRNQSLYHPIYIQFENIQSPGRGWVDLREIDGKTKEELKHDPIVIHINRYIVKKSDFIYQHYTNMFDLNGTIPGLLAHELTHVRDMWSSEYENIALTLSNMSHSSFMQDLQDVAIANNRMTTAYMSAKEAELMSLMFGLMSKFESDARIEAIDKAMSVVPADKIAEIVSKYSDEDDKVINCINEFDYIFGSGIRMLNFGDALLHAVPQTFTKRNIRFQFEFMCFMIHYQFIDDPKDVITGAESMELLYDSNFILDEHIKDLMIKSAIAYHERFEDYLTKLKILISDCLKRRRTESSIEFKLFESIPVQKNPSLKCFYYSEHLINLIYECIYGDEFTNGRPAIKLAYEMSNYTNCSIINPEHWVKRAINEGLTEKPHIWVYDTGHYI